MSKDPDDTTIKSIRIKNGTIEALEELARADSRKFSQYVNLILDQHVAANAKVVNLRRRK